MIRAMFCTTYSSPNDASIDFPSKTSSEGDVVHEAAEQSRVQEPADDKDERRRDHDGHERVEIDRAETARR